MPEADSMEQKLAPMLAALRERIAANDLAPIREGPGWLVYKNDAGEALYANDCRYPNQHMVEVELCIRAQPENRLFWWHSYFSPQLITEAIYDPYLAKDVEAALAIARREAGRADAPA